MTGFQPYYSDSAHALADEIARRAAQEWRSAMNALVTSPGITEAKRGKIAGGILALGAGPAQEDW